MTCLTSKATRFKSRARARAPTPTHKRARMNAHACLHPPIYTHTQKNIILIAFPLQQLFRERALILRYAYIACLVFFTALSFQNYWKEKTFSVTWSPQSSELIPFDFYWEYIKDFG